MNTISMIDELTRRLPVVSPEDQRIGLVALNALARGEPVSVGQLAKALGTREESVEAFVGGSALSPFIHKDEQHRIQGLWGLSVIPTHHQLTVKGRTLWAWCAVDTLLYAELLGDTVEIETRDPETQQVNRLTLSPTRIERAEPAGIVASMVRPQAADFTSNLRVKASACHFIFFFASHASAERWQAKHPETVLLSLDEAFDFAKRANARVFGAELARRRAEAA